MTKLTAASLQAAIAEIGKHVEDAKRKIAIKPRHIIVRGPEQKKKEMRLVGLARRPK